MPEHLGQNGVCERGHDWDNALDICRRCGLPIVVVFDPLYRIRRVGDVPPVPPSGPQPG